jgi:hypothetical protein
MPKIGYEEFAKVVRNIHRENIRVNWFKTLPVKGLVGTLKNCRDYLKIHRKNTSRTRSRSNNHS